jgi:tetratricopeptide (TPR) repeat protein
MKKIKTYLNAKGLFQSLSHLKPNKELLHKISRSLNYRQIKPEQIPSWLLVILAITFPLFYSSAFLNPLGLSKQLLILFLAALILLSYAIINKFSFSFRGGRLGHFVFAFILTAVFSTLISKNPYLSFFGNYPEFAGGLLSILILGGFYFLVINVLNEKWVENILGGVVLGVTLATLLTISQSFFKEVSTFLSLSSPAGVFGTSENWRVALLLTLPLGLGLSFLAKLKWNKIIGSLCLIILSLILFLPQTAKLLSPEVNSVSFSENISLSQKIAEKNLIFGVGPAGVENTLETIEKTSPSADSQPPVLGSIFNKFTNLGVVGLVAYLALIVVFLKTGFRIIKKPVKDSRQYLNLVVFVTALGYLTYQVFSPASFLLDFYFWLLLSLLIVNTEEKINVKIRNSSPLNSYLTVTSVIIVLGFFYLLGRVYEAEVSFAEGSKYRTSGNDKEAVLKIERAADLNPLMDVYKSELGRAQVSLALESFNSQDTSNKPEVESLLDKGIAAVKDALKLNPTLKSNHLALTQVYYNAALVNEEYLMKAIDSAKESVSLFPTDPSIVANLAIIYERTKNFDSAVEIYSKLLDLIPQKAIVYMRIATIYEEKKDLTKAIEYWEKVYEMESRSEIKDKIEELKKQLTENSSKT